jgi:hypothetical protein
MWPELLYLNSISFSGATQKSINSWARIIHQTRQGGALKRLSRLRYMMSAFGLKDEGQASEVEGLLKKAQNASPAEQKKNHAQSSRH